MSNALADACPLPVAHAAVAPPRLGLLGTGTVGRAFVARYQVLQPRRADLPALAWLANSRTVIECAHAHAHAPAQALARANAATRGVAAVVLPEDLRHGDIVVDATASEAVAQRHPEWLQRGVHVVTTNKLGQGAALARAEQIHAARHATGAHYGDSATVGAGLPLLNSLRALAAGGDHIHAVEGVLSGSLAWLLNHYDGSRAFSECVREAMAAGYTEPDPRDDLSGEDVRRKLLILARVAGVPLCVDQVQVESLLPAALAVAPRANLDAALAVLDAPLATRLAQARSRRACLRFVGRFDAHGASVGLRELPLSHPLASGTGTDNRVAIHSDRYRQQPLLIQGPGAGAEVTAAALLDDVLRIVMSERWR